MVKPSRCASKPWIENQSRNGVKVIVTHWPGKGSIVEADCGCFGAPYRVHTNSNCVMLKKNQ
jgi:hypothetical protein